MSVLMTPCQEPTTEPTRGQQRVSLAGRAARAARDAEHRAQGRAHWSDIVQAAFKASNHHGLEARGRRMGDCSVEWAHYANGSGVGRLAPMSCDDRLCPVCTSHRTRGVRELVTRQVESGAFIRFITLTQPAIVGESAVDGRARLMRTWMRFWRSQKRASDPYVRGGVRRVEVTWSRTGAWHWHMHVLATGQYVPQATLSELWQRAGGGPIVDVRAITTGTAAGVEITKYILKVGSMPRDKIVEYALSVAGQRDIQSFGSWYGQDVPEDEAGDGECDELVRETDVELLATSHNSGPSPAELEACARLDATFGERPPLAWRAWATSVYGGWRREVERLEQACQRRAAGRERRDQRERYQIH